MNISVQDQITEAFSRAAPPRGKISVETYDDEGAHEKFAGTEWEEHNIPFLRYYETCMHFFTPEAFRYYLPAFMLAEINDPETADVIAENIAYHFINGVDREVRIAQFNREQLLAIIAFLELCAERYNDGIYDVTFNEAANEVRDALDCS